MPPLQTILVYQSIELWEMLILKRSVFTYTLVSYIQNCVCRFCVSYRHSACLSAQPRNTPTATSEEIRVFSRESKLTTQTNNKTQTQQLHKLLTCSPSELMFPITQHSDKYVCCAGSLYALILCAQINQNAGSISLNNIGQSGITFFAHI